MKLLIILIPLLLTGCISIGSGGNQMEIERDSQGNILREIYPNMSSKAYASLRKVESAEQSNQAFYLAEKAKYDRVQADQIPLLAAIEGLKGVRNPTNYNDTLIAGHAASVEKHKTWAGFGSKALSGGLLGYGIGKAADVFQAGVNNAGDRTTYNVSPDNGSTVSGNVGQDNAFTTNEVLGGIPLEPTTAAPVSLGSVEQSILERCVAAGGDPLDANDQPTTILSAFARCSDGAGGTITL